MNLMALFCISKEGSRAIIDVLDCEYVTGRKNEREISEQFGLTEDALAEFIIAHDYVVSTGSDIEPEMEERPRFYASGGGGSGRKSNH